MRRFLSLCVVSMLIFTVLSCGSKNKRSKAMKQAQTEISAESQVANPATEAAPVETVPAKKVEQKAQKVAEKKTKTCF